MISLTDAGYGETFVSELCGKHTRWELESRQGQALFLRLWFPQENQSPPRVPGMVTGKRNSQFPIPPGQSHWVAIPFPHKRFHCPSCRWTAVFPQGQLGSILIYSDSQSKSNLVCMPCHLSFSQQVCLPWSSSETNCQVITLSNVNLLRGGFKLIAEYSGHNRHTSKWQWQGSDH